MLESFLDTSVNDNKLSLNFSGELDLYNISIHQKTIDKLDVSKIKDVEINLEKLSFIDTAASIFINNLQNNYQDNKINVLLLIKDKEVEDTIALVLKQKQKSQKLTHIKERPFLESFGESIYIYYLGLMSFMAFLGQLFIAVTIYAKSIKNIRFKEIAFEINESAVKAFPIIALTSFLIGVVVAYQSSYQLKLYGANIFLVDMLGISMLRELAPLITAIVIAGRSGSAFTAQIGAMKITEEIDAMRTMGFDPYLFLVLPRVIALVIAMPILIFVADMMGILGGMLVANIDLSISPALFIERFSTAVDAKHFFIGIFKGPFFAFLIASIAIYRGLRVKDDTQSIGFNTTKSVVESIFAVIMCDALFSIAFTNLGI